jgi:hypothetical protein
VAGNAGNLIPAAPGNGRAVKHGAYALVRLEPRANEIADDLRELVPARRDSDEPTIRLLALALAQIEAASAYLGDVGILTSRGKPQPVLSFLTTMMNTASRLCHQLGLTPVSRVSLGLDLARTEETLQEYVDRAYGGKRVA